MMPKAFHPASRLHLTELLENSSVASAQYCSRSALHSCAESPPAAHQEVEPRVGQRDDADVDRVPGHERDLVAHVPVLRPTVRPPDTSCGRMASFSDPSGEDVWIRGLTVRERRSETSRLV